MTWLYTIVPILTYLFLYVSVHVRYSDDECKTSRVITEILANLLGIAGAISAICILYYASLWLG